MVIFIAGAPATGKTTYIKEQIQGVPLDSIFALDLNNEYPGTHQFLNHDDLIDACLNTKGKVVIFEEATSYFSANNTKHARELFTRHRHLNHTIFCNFHSLATIPADLMITADHIYKTRTVEKNVPDMFAKIKDYEILTRDELYQRNLE